MQRYILTEKVTDPDGPTGKVLLDMEYTDTEEVKIKLKELWNAGINPKDTEAHIMDENNKIIAVAQVQSPEEQVMNKVAQDMRKTTSEPDNNMVGSNSNGLLVPKTRKPRKDIGQPRTVKKKLTVDPAKKRNRGIFLVLAVDGSEMTFKECANIFILNEYLGGFKAGTTAKVRVWGGAREYSYRQKIQLTLEPTK